MRVRKQLPVPEAYGDPDWERIWCNWETCDNPASGLFWRLECIAAIRHGRDQRCWGCRKRTFCSAQHLDYDSRSHIPGLYGKLSAGVNGRYL